MLKVLSLLALFTSPLALCSDSNTSDDPFADDPFNNDVIKVNSSNSHNHKSRIELKGYYQHNNLRSDHPFNPGEDLFSDSVKLASLDGQLESNWQNQWKTRGRIYLRYLDEGKKDTTESTLLEGLVQWQSKDRNLIIELGRSKPQWSNGYSYDIANMLQPQRSLPYIDQDNPLQNKGWDMVSGQYFKGPWSFSAYLVESENSYVDANTEAVLRLGYQDNDSFSLILHKIEGQDLSFGATYSSLLTDSITFRTEWTRHSYRQMLNSLNIKQQSNYQRLVLGSTFTAASGWSLTGEYFYNEHGANKQEWESVTADAAASAERLRQSQSTDPATDYKNTYTGLSLMSQGWVRERYFSFMFMSMESEDLWQLRLSSQHSLDDGSHLHRVELLKSFNDNFSARLQWQTFNGCDLCEYGLSPSKNDVRLTGSWLF